MAETGVRSTYREIRPSRALSSRLVCFWTQRIDGAGPPLRHRVLPDGCVDILWIDDTPPLVAGPATRHVIVDLPAGTEVLGLRMKPGEAGGMLGLPADQMLDANVALADIWGAAADRWGDLAGDDRPLERRLDAMAAAAVERMVNSRSSDPVVAACVAWLARHPDGRIDDLAGVADISLRQLQRRFRSAVGYGPKTFHRIVRLQRLLDLAERGYGRGGFADLSHAAGYADQAHMSREVRDLTGLAPSTLLVGRGSTLSMSELFKTDDCEAG